MTRLRLILLFVSLSCTALPQAAVQEPPEEDINPNEKHEYVLNPLQAEKEIRVGNYYFKKGSYRAAGRRYEEATKWDPNSAEGWYRLGETQMKMHNEKAARESWKRYLEIEPEGKYAATVKKHVQQRP